MTSRGTGNLVSILAIEANPEIGLLIKLLLKQRFDLDVMLIASIQEAIEYGRSFPLIVVDPKDADSLEDLGQSFPNATIVLFSSCIEAKLGAHVGSKYRCVRKTDFNSLYLTISQCLGISSTLG